MCDLNVGMWKEDHPCYAITIGPGNRGFAARRRNGKGRPSGRRMAERTLDDLAVRMARNEMRLATGAAQAG